jgi:16S rRNA (guanine527-N7)-methyltransferase
MVELWQSLARTAGFDLDQLQLDRLNRHLQILAKANERFNLTRIVKPEEAGLFHTADALTILPFVPKSVSSILDVGSGGGLPGMVLAIVFPAIPCTLLDATGKKATFLRECAQELGLTNVTALHGRAEDLGHSDLRESFDLVTARAVATLDWLAEWCLPLTRLGGSFVAMKGEKAASELEQARGLCRKLGASEPTLHLVQPIAGLDRRALIVMRKAHRTPSAYPRPASVAKGKPPT